VNPDTLQGEGGGLENLVLAPDTDVQDSLVLIWDEMQLHLLMGKHLADLDLPAEEGNTAIGVDQPAFAQAEDVLGRGVGLGQGEGTEEAVALFQGTGKADAGDLARSGVDLVVVVAVKFFMQDCASIADVVDALQGTLSTSSRNVPESSV
jgi:hypothetical protein